MIYGPESSGKTNLVLKLLGMMQKLHPDLTNVYVDVEHALVPEWGTKMGVNMPDLIVEDPSYAEQAIDAVLDYLASDDVGIVVIDSIAALVPEVETETSAHKQQVGAHPRLVGKLVRKSMNVMADAVKDGRMPMLMYVNQLRYNAGVMMGNPESIPGGMAPKHQSAMTDRVKGKNEMETKISKILPFWKLTNFRIDKWKVPIITNAGNYYMQMLETEDRQPGFVDDWNQVKGYLETLGQIQKNGNKGWLFREEEFKTLTAIREMIDGDPVFAAQVRNDVFHAVMNGELDKPADDLG